MVSRVQYGPALPPPHLGGPDDRSPLTAIAKDPAA
jgi:hypothetical protein